MRKWIDVEGEGLPIRNVPVKIEDADGDIIDAVLVSHFPPLFVEEYDDDQWHEYTDVKRWSYE